MPALNREGWAISARAVVLEGWEAFRVSIFYHKVSVFAGAQVLPTRDLPFAGDLLAEYLNVSGSL